jgi:hypothetical protein
VIILCCEGVIGIVATLLTAFVEVLKKPQRFLCRRERTAVMFVLLRNTVTSIRAMGGVGSAHAKTGAKIPITDLQL